MVKFRILKKPNPDLFDFRKPHIEVLQYRTLEPSQTRGHVQWTVWKDVPIVEEE